VIRNLYSALRIDNSTPTLTPNLKKHPLYQINLLILKYNVEQNDLHLVTFALPLCRSTKKKGRQYPNFKIYIKIPNVIYCEGMRSEVRLNNGSVFLHDIHFNRLFNLIQ
jgi:hypothetical protein